MQHKISDIAEVRMGYHFRGRVREEPAGNALLLQIRDVDERGRFDERELTVVDVPNLENHSLRHRDVVFLARGARRYAFLFEDSLSDSIVPASYFMVLRARESVDPAYLAWAMNQDAFQKQIESVSTKSAVPQITKTRLVELTIDLPDLATQRRIADVDRLMRVEMDLLQRLRCERIKLLCAASRGTVG